MAVRVPHPTSALCSQDLLSWLDQDLTESLVERTPSQGPRLQQGVYSNGDTGILDNSS